METNFKKKLQLSKTVVANLSKREMNEAVGGLPISAGYTCGTACYSAGERCMVQYSGGQVCSRVISAMECWVSVRPAPGGENVTCGSGYMCGSNINNSCIPPCG